MGAEALATVDPDGLDLIAGRQRSSSPDQSSSQTWRPDRLAELPPETTRFRRLALMARLLVGWARIITGRPPRIHSNSAEEEAISAVSATGGRPLAGTRCGATRR